MAFPNINFAQAKSMLQQMYDANGTPVEVLLKDGTSSFTVKMTQGHLRDFEITDGLTANSFKLRVTAEDWDTASPGRPPRKGDQVTFNGRRSALEAVHPRAVGDDVFMYVLVVLG